jgi:FAD:protein FMN transferase
MQPVPCRKRPGGPVIRQNVGAAMHELTFRAMGSGIEAFVDSESDDAFRALRRLPAQFQHWELLFSRFIADSALNRLNATTGRRAARVTPLLLQVIRRSLSAAERSNGLTVPTVLTALERIGYRCPFDAGVSVPGAEAYAAAPTPLAQLAGVRLDPVRRRVRLPAGTGLDLGGIAKSWAAVRAVRTLQRHGPALVSAGGDIAVSGPQADGRPWCVAIGDPFARVPYLALLWLRRGGLATSGTDYRRWAAGGRMLHHIIDPRSGEPAETDLLSVSVVDRDAVTAETLARSLLIRGSAGLAAAAGRRSAPAVLAVATDGRLLISPALRQRLISIDPAVAGQVVDID